MKHNFDLLKADIEEEIHKIKQLQHEFSQIEHMLDEPPKNVAAYDRGAIGYYLHNFYNGCENIFRSVSRFFENDFSDDTWHSDLLKRMKLNIPGYRPAMIDEELFRLLDDFRGFRHKFRHSYSFELDWEKERLVAKKLDKTVQIFVIQVTHFLDTLKKEYDAHFGKPDSKP